MNRLGYRSLSLLRQGAQRSVASTGGVRTTRLLTQSHGLGMRPERRRDVPPSPISSSELRAEAERIVGRETKEHEEAEKFNGEDKKKGANGGRDKHEGEQLKEPEEEGSMSWGQKVTWGMVFLVGNAWVWAVCFGFGMWADVDVDLDDEAREERLRAKRAGK